jgi:hypothetical protein
VSDTPDTIETISTLKDVTALEAFCLASAVASLISQGDPNINQAIVTMADSIYKNITGEQDDDSDAG